MATLRLTVAIVLAFVVAAQTASATLPAIAGNDAPATFTVNSTLDKPDGVLNDGKCETVPGNGECTLRAAIMAANDLSNTTIVVPAGIYTLTLMPVEPWYVPGWFGRLQAIRPMTITGAGPDKTIIDGNRAVLNEPVLVISNTSVISGVTIQNGNGGVIGTNLRVINSVIRQHRAGYTAGDISVTRFTGPGLSGTNITVISSTISDNAVVVTDNLGMLAYGQACGGGVSGQVTLIDSLVLRNAVTATTAQGGGACGTITLINTRVLSNTVTCTENPFVSYGSLCGGGGVYGDIHAYRSVISGNEGGGWDGSGVILDSSIMNNTRDGRGAGVRYIQRYAEPHNTPEGLTIERSLIADNHARGALGSGGGMFVTAGACYGGRGGSWCPKPILIQNITLSGNRADSDGGGIGTSGLVLNHVTLVGNVADADGDGAGKGGAIYTLSQPDPINNGSVALRGSLVAGNLPDQSLGQIVITGETSLITDTLSVVLPLADNGGSTLTHGLPADSPAVNGGNSVCVVDDQRGVRRPYGGRCDLGAFELALGAPPQPSTYLPLVASK
jgi:CSLREA domain-containing protein